MSEREKGSEGESERAAERLRSWREGVLLMSTVFDIGTGFLVDWHWHSVCLRLSLSLSLPPSHLPPSLALPREALPQKEFRKNPHSAQTSL